MIILSNNVPPEDLDRVYGPENYYWYLKSPEFREAFLRPLAEMVNELGLPCLDVGCGEAWLADYLTVPYVGLDGSGTAVATACGSGREVYLERLENPQLCGQFGTVVFGGILDVLVQKFCYVELLELYQARFAARYFVIYDLERLDTAAIEQRYVLRKQFHNSVTMELQEVKKHRKILLFEVSE